VTFVLVVATIWAVRYKRALRQLVRPRLWVFFILITLLTAFVFTRLQSESKTTLDAILIGVEMNLRAIILIMGFTVLGTELYHPKIRETLSNSYFKQLPLALELSVESLPVMIAHTPDLKTIVKNPFLFVQQIMGFADYRLRQIQSGRQNSSNVFIITGNVGAGKTTMLELLIDQLAKEGVSVGGFYQKRIVNGSETIGYDLVEVSSGKHFEFLRTSGTETDSKVGKYFIRNEVFTSGNSILNNAKEPVVFVDEIGKMEIKNEGWSSAFHKLLEKNNSIIIASFRKELLNNLQSHFQLTDSQVFDIDAENKDDLLRMLHRKIRLSLTLTESSST
jgi:nucleoside-triphosphatase THEP1